MTLDEAKKIAEQIIGYADSGCDHCVTDLVERLNKAFPEFVWKTRSHVAPGDENGWQGRLEAFVNEKGLEESEDTTQKKSTYIGNFDVEAVRELFFSDEYYDVLKKI